LPIAQCCGTTLESPDLQRLAVAWLVVQATRPEVMLDALLIDRPDRWRILLPRVDDGAIVAVPHPPGAPLVAGHRGVREPTGVPSAM
jgi:hypothetical protein